MGFCLFHNVGVAAAHARDKLGVKKILIVDWDVHHGNATQNMFWEDDSILFFSLHRWENVIIFILLFYYFILFYFILFYFTILLSYFISHFFFFFFLKREIFILQDLMQDQ